jgi:hypothetical protein
MMSTIPPIREYLLQRLSESELERMEQLLFESDAFFDQVRVEEESLIDEYIQGQMLPADREAFEKRLTLSNDPDGPDDLGERTLLRQAFFAALGEPKQASAAQPLRRTQWASMLAMATAGALAASLPFSVILIRHSRISRQTPVQSASAVMPPAATANPLGAIIFLPALKVRGASAVPIFHVAGRQSMAEIQVQLPTQPTPQTIFRMVVRSKGEIIFQLARIQPRSAGPVTYVSAYLPIETMRPGTYQVDVTSDTGPTEVRIFQIAALQ